MTEKPERVETLDPNPNMDDWTIINKNDNNEDSEIRTNNEGETVIEQEDNKEEIEQAESALESQELTDCKSAEDSDISIIDGDYENEIVPRNIPVSESLEKYDLMHYYERMSSLSQNGITKNVIIVCLLAIIVAMYADHASKIEDPCVLTKNMDLNVENKLLIDHVKDLNEVLSQIKPYIYKLSTAQNREKASPDEFNVLPEQLLQSSLNTLCSIINGVHSVNQPIMDDICESRSIILNLIEFKSIVNSSMHEFDQLKNPSINKFLQEMEQKFSRLCQSLLDDLSVTIDRLILKVYNKLNKANNKLNKWVCALKDNKILYDAFLTSFDKNNVTLENCDEILKNSSNIYNSMKTVHKKRNYVEKDRSSNVTYDIWRKDKSKNKEKYYTKLEKRCSKRKHSDGEPDEICKEFEKSKSHNFNAKEGHHTKNKVLHSASVKSTYTPGKSKKPHTMKGKSKKQKQQNSQYITEPKDSEKSKENAEGTSRNKYDTKEAKYRKYNKKGKKCSNKKCKKGVQYTKKTMKHFKKKMLQNAPDSSNFNTAAQYSKTIILTTERKSREDEDDHYRLDKNADWQWDRRNNVHEIYRRIHSNDPSGWYFERADSRKQARKEF